MKATIRVNLNQKLEHLKHFPNRIGPKNKSKTEGSQQVVELKPWTPEEE